MVSAETADGVNLKEAATNKADESILTQIADKDLALKVKYHKQCYEKYMCKRFPQLVFHWPKLWNKSKIVYAECLSQASVAESSINIEKQLA